MYHIKPYPKLNKLCEQKHIWDKNMFFYYFIASLSSFPWTPHRKGNAVGELPSKFSVSEKATHGELI